MIDSSNISMLVEFEQQRREIIVSIGDRVGTITDAIAQAFELQSSNILNEYQVQFYHSNYGNFIDLYDNTWIQFQTLLHELSTQASIDKSTNSWRLKVVPKIPGILSSISHGAVAQEIRSFNQQNLIIEQSNENEFLSTLQALDPILNRIPSDGEITLDLSALSFSNGVHGALPPYIGRSDAMDNRMDHGETQTQGETESSRDEYNSSQHSSENHNSVQSENQEPEETDFFTSKHFRLNEECFKLKRPLVDKQRYQYLSEIIMRDNNGKLLITGCLLKSVTEENAPEDYPTFQISIKPEYQNVPWSMKRYVLTECDAYGNHYVHPSKGLFDMKEIQKLNGTIRFSDDEENILANSLVNPLTTDLKKEDIENQTFKIHDRVINRVGLPRLKMQSLTPFCQIIHDTQSGSLFLSRYKSNVPYMGTLTSLKLSPEKFHIGYVAVCQDQEISFCISNMCHTPPRY
ncbi:unnamed protein product [Rotaria magnacalcarata]|uniref:Uncharacterized protein n=3 Tax=Rotaria magnacalcarata TaxID=392030 RepID=A0A814NJR3_9BILA|nr:unnamed protein product [Rotaria magnacalcarata]